MADHARALVVHHADDGGERLAMRTFRKHASWYLTGYPVGSEARRRFAQVSTLAELDDLAAGLDPTLGVVPGGERIRRGHTNGPIRVALPDGFLDDLDALEHDVTRARRRRRDGALGRLSRLRASTAGDREARLSPAGRPAAPPRPGTGRPAGDANGRRRSVQDPRGRARSPRTSTVTVR